ncbi:unnamed protein product [Caretta caretta]
MLRMQKNRTHRHRSVMNSTISQSESEVSSMAWIPHREDLQRYLDEGEYPPFRSVAMFESNFIQITRKGKNVDVHNHPTEATIGIISTDNKLPLPNIMLIARPVPRQNGQVSAGCRTEQLVLTRLLPLKFVRISVHDPDRQRIKLKLINGRSYYLQLYASPGEQQLLFDRWLSLIYLLHHPPDCYLRPNSCMCRDNLSVQILASEEEEEVVCPSQHPQLPPMIIPSHMASPLSLSNSPESQNKAQEDADAEEKGKEEVGNAASPLGESSSRESLIQGPSTDTKPELNSESKEHESLTQTDVVRNEGDLGERANSSSLHSSTALDQARLCQSQVDRGPISQKVGDRSDRRSRFSEGMDILAALLLLITSAPGYPGKIQQCLTGQTKKLRIQTHHHRLQDPTDHWTHFSKIPPLLTFGAVCQYACEGVQLATCELLCVAGI